MSLVDKLRGDLTDAQKSKEEQRTETLRGLLSSIHNEEIAKRSKGGESELSDEDVIAVLQREAKKRKESAEVYGSANRADLEKKEKDELQMIEEYLPARLGSEEIEKIIDGVISGGEDNFGKVMGAVMGEVAGRADARVVSEAVKKRLGSEDGLAGLPQDEK